MDGPPIRQARLALLAALDRLSPDDTFAILAFNEEVHPFAPGFAPAAGAALDGARAWVAALEAGGGTLIGHALRTALGMMEESATGDDGVLSRIVFLTDGAVGNEDEVVRAIHRHPGRVRLHTLGIGPAPNRHLMRQMAEAGRGLSGFIASIEGVDNRIDAFLARLDRPVLAEPRLEWDGPPPADVHPAILPDLHAGEPLLVSARLAPGVSPGRPFLTGRGPHGPVRLPIDPAPAAGSDRGIAVRWARARIEALMDGVHAGADPDAVRRAVIDLSLAFGIVSPFTSMVAVERFPTAATDAGLVRVPSALPSAGSGDLVLAQGGTDDALRFLIGLALLAVGGLLMLCDRLVSQGGVFPGHPPARSPGGFVGRLRAVRPWRRARS
jgi:Ca-activated chloride channel family protein